MKRIIVMAALQLLVNKHATTALAQGNTNRGKKVEFFKEDQKDNSDLIVSNMLGKVVYRSRILSGTARIIATEDLQSGLYNVTISSGSFNLNTRVVVMH